MGLEQWGVRMKLLDCILYVAGIGILSNVVGALIPRKWLHADRFPFRVYRWEHLGQFYVKLGMRKWKDKVPDMSKILPWLYPKKVERSPADGNLQRLIQESCVAELIHWLLIVTSLGVVKIWPGKWGWFVWLLCWGGNLPFIFIQRFNRPRFVRMLDRMQAGKA